VPKLARPKKRCRLRSRSSRLRSRSLRVTSRSFRAQKYCVACPRDRREREKDGPCRLRALPRVPGEDAFGQRIDPRRFWATRCDPGLSRFDKMWTRMRSGSARSCRRRTRIDFGCANVVAGRPVVTRDARERVKGARSRPRDASFGPRIDAIASREHAITSGEHAIALWIHPIASGDDPHASSVLPTVRLPARPPVLLPARPSVPLGEHLETKGHTHCRIGRPSFDVVVEPRAT
jgi:hypothetical protein